MLFNSGVLEEYDHGTFAEVAAHGPMEVSPFFGGKVAPFRNPIKMPKKQASWTGGTRLAIRNPILAAPCFGRVKSLKSTRLVKFYLHKYSPPGGDLAVDVRSI